MSLKTKIEYYLNKNGSMTLLELENLCKSEKYKLSNAERRLRELMASNPNIKPVKNSAGAIIAYRLESHQTQNPAPSELKRTYTYQSSYKEKLCPQCHCFMNHLSTCPTLVKEVKEIPTLF